MLAYPLIQKLYVVFKKPELVDNTAFKKELASLEMQEPDSVGFSKGTYPQYLSPGKNYYGKAVKGELFYFDPNTLPVEGWLKLGLREKTANTIQKYLSKGGRFYNPEDIGKIWGLREDEVKRLLPYVRIEGKPVSGYNKFPDKQETKTYENSKYTIVSCDVNMSDTAAFIALPGIGSKLAARIVSFREKLGGFYKINQVAETYGLPDSTFQKIKTKLVISNNNVKKLNINTASVDELKTHPYLRYNLANAIVQYRAQHGNFSSVNDLKKILMITEEIYNKAVPYLTIK